MVMEKSASTPAQHVNAKNSDKRRESALKLASADRAAQARNWEANRSAWLRAQAQAAGYSAR